MSTKAVREALRLLTHGAPIDSPRAKAASVALAEVEVVEKAAKPIVEKVRLNDIVHEMPDHCQMMVTLPAGVWRALVKAVDQ